MNTEQFYNKYQEMINGIIVNKFTKYYKFLYDNNIEEEDYKGECLIHIFRMFKENKIDFTYDIKQINIFISKGLDFLTYKLARNNKIQYFHISEYRENVTEGNINIELDEFNEKSIYQILNSGFFKEREIIAIKVLYFKDKTLIEKYKTRSKKEALRFTLNQAIKRFQEQLKLKYNIQDLSILY